MAHYDVGQSLHVCNVAEPRPDPWQPSTMAAGESGASALQLLTRQEGIRVDLHIVGFSHCRLDKRPANVASSQCFIAKKQLLHKWWSKIRDIV